MFSWLFFYIFKYIIYVNKVNNPQEKKIFELAKITELIQTTDKLIR